MPEPHADGPGAGGTARRPDFTESLNDQGPVSVREECA